MGTTKFALERHEMISRRAQQGSFIISASYDSLSGAQAARPCLLFIERSLEDAYNLGKIANGDRI